MDLVAELTARLASAIRLEDIADVVRQSVTQLGVGGVWLAVLDEQTDMLSTLLQVIDGIDTTLEVPRQYSLDLRLPVGRGFQQRRMFNVTDPSMVIPLDGDDAPIRSGKLGLPRKTHDQLRNRPFASGPLYGSRGEPVGALGLASLGPQPFSDEALSGGVLRAFIDHLGIAVERALNVEAIEANLRKAQASIINDAPVKAVGEIAVSVAHDLNNLAVVALLAAEVGQRSPTDALDVLPRIARTTRAIGALVGRLQRIARPSAGAAEVADLQQTVDDILIIVKPILRESSIDLAADIPAVPPVRCDSVLLHQVIVNLLFNADDALHAVPPEQRRIELRVRHIGDRVRLTVADTGPGIAPEVLATLFQPFRTTKRDGHLGLGLAGAQTSLRQFGAQIEGRNRSTGGAEFEVVLRVGDVAPEPPAPAPSPPPSAQPRTARVLAIDDDPDIVQVIRDFLEPLGHQVATAISSDEAIAATRSQTFDVVLCDLGMPKQRGLDVCELLRDSGYRGKLVLMTGWSHSLAGKPLPAQSDLLLSKPFVGSELVGAIEALLP